MSEKKKKRDNLPLLFRIIMKFPKLSLEGFSGEFQGIFWAMVVPIFLTAYIFLVLVFIFYLPSPINIIAVTTTTGFICALCLRILVERELKSLEMQTESSGFTWNVKESFKDYEKLIEKKEQSE